MATITIFPFPEYGHLNPTLKLARALKQAGHRVCYLGFKEFEAHLGSQGMEFIPILDGGYSEERDADRPTSVKIGDLAFSPLEMLEAGYEVAAQAFGRIAKAFERIILETHPDLLIVDYMIGGFAYIAAHKCGITSALISPSLLDMPMLGAPAYDPQHLQLPVLVLCPEEFDFRHAEKKPNRYYIEPSVDLQRNETRHFPWSEIDQTKPLIYCSLGSLPHLYEHSSNLYRAIIEAMSEKPDQQLVLAVGRHLACESFHPVPENTCVVNWPPQLELIKKASIMITHGGLGTVKECIFFGVPMIVFPCRWDQPFNAARVAYHGMGIQGNINNVSARQISSFIDAIDRRPSFRSRTEAMGRIFRERENSGRGVKVIERILNGGTVHNDGLEIRG